jgi:hypothetical protein
LLKNTIHKPLAYFTTLKKRFTKGELDLSEYDNGVIEKKKEKQQQTHREYINALLDYENLKKTFEQDAKTSDCTFSEHIKKLKLVQWWEDIVTNLKTLQVQALAPQ